MSGANQDQNASRPPAPSASSFLSAMAQLNQQYTPSQRPVPPLLPNATSALAANSLILPSSSMSVSPGDLTNLGRLQFQQFYPATPPRTSEDLHNLSMRIFNHVLKDWEPHPLSLDEIEKERRDIRMRLARIHLLEVAKARLHPYGHLLALEYEYLLANMDYRTRVFRTFPINDLPVELIGHIFRLSLEWPVYNPKRAIRDRTILTSVCRRWRAVALSDANLWTYLWFSRLSVYDQCFEFFERARNSILDVMITDTPQEPLTLEVATRIVDRLFVKLSNIRSLIIVVQDWDPALCFFHSLSRVRKEGVPMVMEHFELHRNGSQFVQVGSGYEPSFYQQPMALFGGAHIPSLRHITINAVHVDWDESKDVFVGLTKLDVRRLALNTAPTAPRFRALLSNCPNLAHLVLVGAGPQWQGPYETYDVSPVPLPHVKTLVLGYFSFDYGLYLLSFFRASNVTTFTLMSLSGSDPLPFLRRLTGQMPLLTSLTLENLLATVDLRFYRVCAQWYKSMPLLRTLRIVDVAQSVLEPFLYDSDTGRPNLPRRIMHPICPQLTSVEIRYLNPTTPLNTRHLSDWVQFRHQIKVPPRTVCLDHGTMERLGTERETLRQTLRGFGTDLMSRESNNTS